MSKTIRNCSGPVDWKTQVFMVYRGTCTGSDFCVSMTWDHQRDGYEAGCAPGVWRVESGPGML